MQKILLFAVFLLNSVLLFAQSNNPANGTQPEKWCGTTDLSTAKLRELRPTPPKPYKGAGPTLYIPMTLHIVGNDNGSGYYPLRNAYDAFCQLQTDYAPADMVFYLVDTIRYHQNTVYNNHQDFTVGGDMVADYSQPGTLNCFITEVAAGACAYAWYGGAIVLKKSCTTRPNHTWAHEAGHYFSLPHVFVGWEGQSVNAAQPAPAVTNDGTEVELADSSNCTTAGDLFCDTPADYISKRWSCDANHNSQTLIDPTGAPFKASGEYYMSYSSDACMSRFSPQQITAMRDYAQTTLNTITHLTAPPDQPLLPTSLVSPADSLVTRYDSLTFRWNSDPHATKYILEVSRLSSFVNTVVMQVTTDTSFTAINLLQNKHYFWRVHPINARYMCTPVTNGTFFTQLAPVATQNNPVFTGQLSVIPTQIQRGQTVAVEWQNIDSETAKLQVFSINGQLLSEKTVYPTIQQTTDLATTALSTGVFIVNLQTERGNVQQKLVISE